MKFVYIGEIVNTHGLKGELRIISSFKYKKNVFVKGMHFYLGKRKQEVILNTYRVHKNYDMTTFENINDINEAIIFKGDSVYINRDDIDVAYVNEDIIGIDVYDKGKYIGKVTDITSNTVQEILIVKDENRNHMIPNIDEFVKKIDIENRRIDIESIEGLLNEN